MYQLKLIKLVWQCIYGFKHLTPALRSWLFSPYRDKSWNIYYTTRLMFIFALENSLFGKYMTSSRKGSCWSPWLINLQGCNLQLYERWTPTLTFYKKLVKPFGAAVYPKTSGWLIIKGVRDFKWVWFVNVLFSFNSIHLTR